MKKIQLLIIALLAAVAVNAANPLDSCTRVRLQTSEGDIVVALYNDTPRHRDNFIKLVSEGYYDGLLFHRVIENFMIQSGDPDSRDAAPKKRLGEGGPDYTIDHEILYPTHFHKRGALAAAREGDNVNPEMKSSGSQFYIVWGKQQTSSYMDEMQQRWYDSTDGDFEIPEEIIETYETLGGTPHLDGAYTVFGEVTEGLDVVKKIQWAKTDKYDRPKADIKIIKAEVVK